MMTKHPNTSPFPIVVLGVPTAHTQNIHDKAYINDYIHAHLHNVHCIAAPQGLMHHAPDNTEKIPLDAHIHKCIELITQRQQESKRVLLLVHGDPLYFGIGSPLIQKLGTHAVHIIPSVSIIQHMCAHLGLPWHNIHHLSLHGRNTDAHWLPLFHAILANKCTCVLTDKKASPQYIAQQLFERGAQERSIHIFNQWGSHTQKHHCLSLAQCMNLKTPCPQPSTILIMPSTKHKTPILGIPAAELACENSLMTKLPVRATALSLLQLTPKQTLWDVGSGSGALALEACALLHEGQCIAIEHNAKRVAHIHENRRTFGALNLHICHGRAPDCLNHLPAPHKIFVGGSLSTPKHHAILDTLCQHLLPHGRIVISCVLLNTLHNTQNYFAKKNWTTEITHIQVTQSTALGADLRLVPQNPVFLLLAQKNKIF